MVRRTLVAVCLLVTAVASCSADGAVPRFADVLEHHETHPDDPEAQTDLEAAATRLIQDAPLDAVSDEVLLLRWLEAEERWNDLLEVLDRSRVTVPGAWGTSGSSGGRPDEEPQRLVFIDAFRIDRYEVTNLQYQRFLRATGEQAPEYWPGGEIPEAAAMLPVVAVSWRQADAYCAWAGSRLPSEAEWERACRGTSGLTYPWGDSWDPARANVTPIELFAWEEAMAWLRDPAAAPARLRPVGDPPTGASPYGVCNLAGNAIEWVADWYAKDAYHRLPAVNPLGSGPPWNHVLRGDAWLNRYPELVGERSRCAFRSSSHSIDDVRTGFRCGQDA